HAPEWKRRREQHVELLEWERTREVALEPSRRHVVRQNYRITLGLRDARFSHVHRDRPLAGRGHHGCPWPCRERDEVGADWLRLSEFVLHLVRVCHDREARFRAVRQYAPLLWRAKPQADF